MWRWRCTSFRCPLTPLEIHLRELAGQAGYEGGFIDQYIMAIVYPSGLTPTIQLWMAAGLVLLNTIAYGVLGARHRRRVSTPDSQQQVSYTHH